jgi:hypothetical protein
MRLTSLVGAFGVAVLVAGCGSAGDSSRAPRASVAHLQAHVNFLADDLLEGREAGTRGYDLAALYIANQYRALGLTPAGDQGSWYQAVPMRRVSRLGEGARLTLKRGSRSTEFTFIDQWMPGSNANAESASLSAPLVFVGHGVHAPELGYDDFAGVDLNGKIAVYVGGAPSRFPNSERAHYSSSRVKGQTFTARGAVGSLSITLPKDEARYPWARGVRNWQRPGMRLLGPDGKPVDSFPQLTMTAGLNLEASRALFEGAAQDFDAVVAAELDGKLKSFDLDGTLSMSARWKHEPVQSHNVVGKLEGSDPVLAAEHVVFTAHLDHIGTNATGDGDRINNGAVDNAVGVAAMLEAARDLGRGVARPKRSVLFIALTAEEKGLLGSQYFAGFPTVPADSLVANVNLDMPLILADQRDVIGIGIEHSSLERVVERATRELGLTVSADPFPEEVVFVRSDQYSFVRQGIPAVYLDGGVKALDPTVDMLAVMRDFLSTHYHQPSDDLSRPIHWETVARFADLNARIGFLIANDPARPTWNEGDFFGEKFGKK